MISKQLDDSKKERRESQRIQKEEALDNRSYKQARFSTGLDFMIPVTQEDKDYLN